MVEAAVALKTEGLTKRFGSLTAVQGLALEVYAGEIFGFLGPNGAGKTTVIKMLCGLLKPDVGQVFIQGQAVTAGSAAVRQNVGLCPQELVIWGKLTCLEQLEFIGGLYGLPHRLARQRAGQLLEALGLAEKSHSLGSTLSGGMQRRLNLALALVHEPQLLILDEPEAGLDPQGRVLVREFIQAWARVARRTVILTTHNMDEAERMVQRVAIMDHGRLLVVDTPEALKRRLGAGDILEIDLPDHGRTPEDAQQALAGCGLECGLVGTTLVIRTPAAVEQVALIVETLKKAGFQPGEVRLRSNSLEDVFIALTGRRLRE
jgi:ABC-2 type transport system ATP-binding protein